MRFEVPKPKEVFNLEILYGDQIIDQGIQEIRKSPLIESRYLRSVVPRTLEFYITTQNQFEPRSIKQDFNN
jgi:hypothetical protein